MLFHSYVEYKTETCRHGQQYGSYQREGAGESLAEGKEGPNIW